MDQTINKLDTSKQIIYFSRFNPESDVGGGARRTAQIAEALKSLDFAFVSSRDCPWDYKILSDYPDYVQAGGLPTGYIEKWQPSRRDDVAFMHYVSWSWSIKVMELDSLKLALIDDPLYFSPLVKYLVYKGIPVVALCQNIESLSRSQIMDEYQMELFNYELGILACCALVVTISREETVLLRNLGMDAFYFPYYPVKDIQERMTRISETRKGTKKQDFLLVGTADNPPTMNGMQELIKRWPAISSLIGGVKLYVGGYGSGTLKDLADGKTVVFKGVLSDEDLDNVLTTIKGCIVYQADGSGALTKICESLIAGVPIIANSHAARSYYNIPGMVEFTDFNDIDRALSVVDSKETEIKVPAPPDLEALLCKIRELSDISVNLKLAIKCLVEKMIVSGETIADISDYGLRKIIREVISEQDLKLRAERDAIAIDRDALITQREKIYNSLSWRITAPLRYVAKFFLN